MQSRPTFSPFEVEGKLLRDSPLEETLQYGEHQQTRVHAKVRNMVNPNECPPPPPHLATFGLCRCRVSVRLKLCFDDTQKWSKSRTANKNIHINAPNNAYVYGQAEEEDETGARFLELSVSWIKALTHSLALNHHTHTYIFIIYTVDCVGKKENSCVLLPPVTSKHLWLLVEAPTAWCTALRTAQEPPTSVIRHHKWWCYHLNHTAGRNGDKSNGCLGWHLIQSRWTMQWWKHRYKEKETVNYIPTALSGYLTSLSDRTHSAFCCLLSYGTEVF